MQPSVSLLSSPVGPFVTTTQPNHASALRQLALDYHEGKLARGDYRRQRHAMISAITTGHHYLQPQWPSFDAETTAVLGQPPAIEPTGDTCLADGEQWQRVVRHSATQQHPKLNVGHTPQHQQHTPSAPKPQGLLRALAVASLLVMVAAALGVMLSRLAAS